MSTVKTNTVQVGQDSVTPANNFVLTTDGAGSLLVQKNSTTPATVATINATGLGSSGVSYLPAGTGAVATTVQTKLRESVSVKDFGAVGNGIADDTAAINAAIAALPTNGGSVFFPDVGPYACNLVITKNNITLEGVTAAGGTNDVGGRVTGLVPYTSTSPVIQVGNDSGYVHGFQATNLSLWRASAGQYGLRLHGGVNSARFTNIRVAGFTRKSVWIENGATYPIAFVYFTNFSASCGTTGLEEDVILINSVSPQYTSAVYFSNGYTNVGSTGYSVHIKNTTGYFSNFWVQAATNQGVFLDYTGATSPKLVGSNFFVDSSSSTDILLELNYTASGAKNPAVFISGNVSFDGYAKFYDATTANIGGVSFWGNTATVLSPVNVSTSYLTETTDVTQRDMSLSRSGTTLTIQSPGNIQIIPTAGDFRPGSSITYDMGASSRLWRNTYTQNVRPGAGTVIWTSGAGTPEASVTAPVGSLYTRTDGGATTTLYVKESGVGNTGWVAK